MSSVIAVLPAVGAPVELLAKADKGEGGGGFKSLKSQITARWNLRPSVQGEISTITVGKTVGLPSCLTIHAHQQDCRNILE